MWRICRNALTQVALGAVVTAAALSAIAVRAADERETTTALGQLLAAETFEKLDAELWTAVREFYRLRHGATAWTTQNAASAALGVLRSAVDHGLTPATYGEAGLRRSHQALEAGDDSSDRAIHNAEFDARLTGPLLP